MWLIDSAEGPSVVATDMYTRSHGYTAPDDARCSLAPADSRRANVRSVYTGYDSTGQRYELCAEWYEAVWRHTAPLVATRDWKRPQSPQHAKALIVALFATKILTPRYGGFRKPNTTKRAAPRKRRSCSEGTADDPEGYWETEITREPRRVRTESHESERVANP